MSISQKGRGARRLGLAMGVGLAALVAGANGARAEGAEDSWSVGWSNGTTIVSPDKSVDIKVGGFFQVDFLMDRFNNQADNLSGVDDGSGVIFRRARIYSEGTLFEDFFFKAEYDFAGGDAQFKDVYAGIQNLPCGSKLRVGHFKEPFSLEQLTSDKFITFNERSLADAFSPSRNTGVMWNGTTTDQASSAPSARAPFAPATAAASPTPIARPHRRDPRPFWLIDISSPSCSRKRTGTHTRAAPGVEPVLPFDRPYGDSMTRRRTFGDEFMKKSPRARHSSLSLGPSREGAAG